MRMTSKPLIVADAVANVLNLRVEFISRFLALPSVSYADADHAQTDREIAASCCSGG
jgi:hypothetical protein